jgi:signal transduction histidine kinase
MDSLYVDKDKMLQVLINLLQNAIDVSEAGDIIEVVSRIDKKKQCAVIKVNDEGPGIPEDDREKIFNLFYTTKKGNSGMGLAISKRIIKDHKGNIRVEPRKKKGTSMVIEIPLKGKNA